MEVEYEEPVKEEAPPSPPAKKQVLKQRSSCAGRCLCGFFILLLLIGILTGLLYWKLVLQEPAAQPVASCGGCHCIANGTCPTRPTVEFSDDMMNALGNQTALNAITLTCNPFFDTDCVLDQADPAESVVCGLHYTDGTCTDYAMQSYPDRNTAEEAGAFVTHVGSCGVCSTTQDLSVYMRLPDLTTEALECGKEGLTANDYDTGLACVQALGFSTPCAKVWTDHIAYTGSACGRTCLLLDALDKSYNGPPPQCELNDCLTCNMAKAWSTMELFAGRTPERSGLLSSITRPCAMIAEIEQEACPATSSI